MLCRELEDVYRDWQSAEGRCCVRIYDGCEAADNLPVVILTNPNDNHGPSVTNTIEQIGAEVLTRYLPEQDGLEPPAVIIEHYPDRQPRGVDARWHDPLFGETFDVVTFGHWSGRATTTSVAIVRQSRLAPRQPLAGRGSDRRGAELVGLDLPCARKHAGRGG